MKWLVRFPKVSRWPWSHNITECTPPCEVHVCYRNITDSWQKSVLQTLPTCWGVCTSGKRHNISHEKNREGRQIKIALFMGEDNLASKNRRTWGLFPHDTALLGIPRGAHRLNHKLRLTVRRQLNQHQAGTTPICIYHTFSEKQGSYQPHTNLRALEIDLLSC